MAWGVRLRAIEQMKLLGQCRVDGLELHAIEQMQWNAVASTAWKLHAIEQLRRQHRVDGVGRLQISTQHNTFCTPRYGSTDNPVWAYS